MTAKSRELPTCPECWESPLVPVIFGMATSELGEAADRGELILGGCAILDFGKVVGCVACEAMGVLQRRRFIPIDEAIRIQTVDLDADDLVHRHADLLRHNMVRDLRWLADRCIDVSLDGDFTIEALPSELGPGIRMHYQPDWLGRFNYEHHLYYPFTNEYFWEVVDAFGDVGRFDMNLEGLASTISDVEGFNVWLEAVPYGSPDTRLTALGKYVCEVPEYTFKRPMGDEFTVTDWRTKRLQKACPGFRAEFADTIRGALTGSETLGFVRGEGRVRRPPKPV